MVGRENDARPAWQKLLWFVLIWAASVVVLAVIGGIIRWAILP